MEPFFCCSKMAANLFGIKFCIRVQETSSYQSRAPQNLALCPCAPNKKGAPEGELTLRTSVITHGSKGDRSP